MKHSRWLHSRWLNGAVAVVALGLGATFPSWAAETAAAKPAVAAEQQALVNINTASAEQLAAGLVGVGPAKAQAIVAYREANGPFTDKVQLLDVKGIGQAIFDKNQSKIGL